MKPYYQDSSVTIYHGDCREILPELEAMDVCFTSPPYLAQREYELDSFDWYAVVPKAISLVPDTGSTQVLVNLGQVHKDGEIIPYWDALIAEMKKASWRWFGMYIWDQGSGLPGDWNGRFGPSHELIFHFNRSAVRPEKFVPKLPDSGPMGSNLRSKDGINGKPSSVCEDPNKIPDSVVRLGRAISHGIDHPAVFPERLAKFILQAWPGSIIDPFMGSGTTLRAAKDLGRKAIGIEIEERYCEIAAKRMAQEVFAFN